MLLGTIVVPNTPKGYEELKIYAIQRKYDVAMSFIE